MGKSKNEIQHPQDEHEQHAQHYAKVMFLVLLGATIVFCGSVILFVL